MSRIAGILGVLAGLMTLAFAASSALAGGGGGIIISEGFEFPFPGSWSVADDNAANTPAYWGAVSSGFGGEAARAGSKMGYCAAVGYAGTESDPLYQNSMSARMSQPIDLTSYSSATLSFWYKIPNIEDGFDYLRVYMDSTLLWQRNYHAPNWAQAVLPLTSYAGGIHTLKFVFDTDGTVNREGVYLDDLSLIGVPAAATIRDAWWDLPSDIDGDGYPGAALLSWSPAVAGGVGTANIMNKVYYKRASSSTWTLWATTPNYVVTGSGGGLVYSMVVTDATLTGLSHDKYDWKIEAYRPPLTSSDYVRRDTNDAELNDVKLESTAEEADYLPHDIPLSWYLVPCNFGFDVRDGRWAAVGINPLGIDRDLLISPHPAMTSPTRVSSLTGGSHDFLVLNGTLLHALPYYARVQDGLSNNYYYIEAENSPSGLTPGRTLSGRSFVASDVLDLYQVSLSAGHTYPVSVSQSSASTVDLAVFLFKPTRKTAARAERDFSRNSSGVGRSETLTFIAKYSGRWGILVTNENGGAGHYSIKVERLR